jgi:uncharacterized protein (TIGR02246 family)
MTADEWASREVIATWLRASAAGDNATVRGLMADDVVFLVPGRPPFGKEAFAAAQGGLAQFRFEATSDVKEVRVSGNWAHCWTSLTVVTTPADGSAPARPGGHTLSVFQRVADGRWVLARDANLLAVEN